MVSVEALVKNGEENRDWGAKEGERRGQKEENLKFGESWTLYKTEMRPMIQPCSRVSPA
jgi:hypothetical protein